jgi:hypothetical protein
VSDSVCETRVQILLDTLVAAGEADFTKLHNHNDQQTVCAGFTDGVNAENIAGKIFLSSSLHILLTMPKFI